ncbi:hypothetical protein MKX01_020967 [Papaver californicum]|nr:hypothetical protein MKX01_020967 [Papaver californicum]
MAVAAAEGLFRCVFEGCISTSDTYIERRPYHKNCSCALHRSSSKTTTSSATTNCSKTNKKLSYPMRRSWSEGCLALSAASNNPSSSNNNNNNSNSSSSCTSPVATAIPTGGLYFGGGNGKGKPPRLFKVESLGCMYKPDYNY